MDDLGRRDQGSAGRGARRRIAVGAVVLAGALAIGVAPVVGEGTSPIATPNEQLVVNTVPATKAQVAGSGTMSGAMISAKKKKKMAKKVEIESRITDSETPIVSEVNRGTFVGIKCPNGSIAISGGVVTSYIDLLISHSAPNNPLTGAYTPRMWWLTVTNANLNANDRPLPWRGVVNCMSPARVKR